MNMPIKPIYGAIAPIILLFLFCGGCDLPRDPEGTYSHVVGRTMRVGINANPPWTRLDGDRPKGIEVELLEEFAKRLDAQIEWRQESESKLLEALEGGALEVVIGGLKDSTPWSDRVALTQPFAEIWGEKHVMTVRRGENRWLLELDRFLQSRRGQVIRRFQEESPK